MIVQQIYENNLAPEFPLFSTLITSSIIFVYKLQIPLDDLTRTLRSTISATLL